MTTAVADTQTRLAEIVTIRQEAVDILSFALAAVDGATLPPFAAGAHIDLHIAPDRLRQYSLSNSTAERDRYLIAVKLEHGGRGGSRYLHEQVRVGSRIAVGAPRNTFHLPPGRAPLLFIAGGVGITPIRAMLHQAEYEGRDWQLHYAARSKHHTAFHDELAAYGDRVRFWWSESGERLPTRDIIAEAGHVVLRCCGPERLMTEVEHATAAWHSDRVGFERFRGKLDDGVANRPFDVELRRSGLRVHVPADVSLLDALRSHGVDVPFACQEGVCGTCETRVLAGTIDHRDQLLTEQERASGQVMMPCVSRARSGKLVLDL